MIAYALVVLPVALALVLWALRTPLRDDRPRAVPQSRTRRDGPYRPVQDPEYAPATPGLLAYCLVCERHGTWTGHGPGAVYTPPPGHAVIRWEGGGGVLHDCPVTRYVGEAAATDAPAAS